MKKQLLSAHFLSLLLFTTSLIQSAQNVIFEIGAQNDPNPIVIPFIQCQICIIDRPIVYQQNMLYNVTFNEQTPINNNRLLVENNNRILEKRYHKETHKIRLLQNRIEWQRFNRNNQELSSITYNCIGNDAENNNNVDFQHIQNVDQNNRYGVFVLKVSNDRPVTISNVFCQVFINNSTKSIDDGYSTYYTDQNIIKNDKTTNGMYAINNLGFNNRVYLGNHQIELPENQNGVVVNNSSSQFYTLLLAGATIITVPLIILIFYLRHKASQK